MLSVMASTRLSGCDMGTSFPPKAEDSVRLLSVFLAQELWLFPWESDGVGIRAEHLWKCCSGCRSLCRDGPSSQCPSTIRNSP